MAHTGMFRSILYQVLEQSRQAANLVLETYRQKPPFSNNGRPYVWDLHELEAMLKAIEASVFRMICVLDGLDESEDGEQSFVSRETLLDKLLKLVSPDPKYRLKLIVLSRPSRDIKKSFYRRAEEARSSTTHVGQYRKIVMQDFNTEDIQPLVTAGLRELQQMKSASFSPGGGDGQYMPSFEPDKDDDEDPLGQKMSAIYENEETTMQTIQQLILAKANGVILWVTLVLSTLKTRCNLRGASSEELLKLLEELPPDLEELYIHIVGDLKKTLPADILQKARSVLMWVSAASSIRALTLEELWDALAIPDEATLSRALREHKDYRVYSGIRRSSWSDFCAVLSDWCGPFVEVVQPPTTGKQAIKGADVASFSQILRDNDRKEGKKIRNADAIRDGPVDRCAVVQLLHQTVKDFLANSAASDCLHFTEDEAKHHFWTKSSFYAQIQERIFRTYHDERRWNQSAISLLEDRARETVIFLNDKCFLLYYLRACGRQSNDGFSGLVEMMFSSACRDHNAVRGQADKNLEAPETGPLEFTDTSVDCVDLTETAMGQLTISPVVQLMSMQASISTAEKKYIEILFKEVYDSGTPLAVELLLRLPEVGRDTQSSWWTWLESPILELTLAIAAQNDLHREVQILVGGGKGEINMDNIIGTIDTRDELYLTVDDTIDDMVLAI